RASRQEVGINRWVGWLRRAEVPFRPNMHFGVVIGVMVVISRPVHGMRCAIHVHRHGSSVGTARVAGNVGRLGPRSANSRPLLDAKIRFAVLSTQVYDVGVLWVKIDAAGIV